MDPETIRARKREIEERHGAWINHNIRLADGVFTMDPEMREHRKLRRITQIVEDLLGGQPEGLRILDLGSFEGQYAVEMVLRGASAVAVEGRAANLEKMRLAKDALGLDRMELRLDDVRNLSRERDGEFDVILCLGILYHLGAADVFQFVERMYEMCRRFVVIDTHIALRPTERHQHRGWTYWGWPYVEHAPETTAEQKEKSLLASLDNPESTWFTRESLSSLLARTGFSSVFECQIPAWERREDRIVLVAIKGTRVRHACMPDRGPEIPVSPEPPPPPPAPSPTPGLLRRLARRLPTRVKRVLKRWMT